MITSGYTMEAETVTDLAAVAEAVVYRAPNKNNTEVRKAIGEAAREFLKRTGVWKECRNCSLVSDGWYGFKHGYLNAAVIRIDQFGEGLGYQRMEGEPEGVAPIPCGIPMPYIGNPAAPTIANFIEQGGYVLVAAPGAGPVPCISTPYQPEDGSIPPVMVGKTHSDVGVAVFTLNLAFGGEFMPERLVQRYGDTLADGAAHILLTGPNVARTSYGDKFTNACDALAMRMANGSPTASVMNGRIFSGMTEV